MPSVPPATSRPWAVPLLSSLLLLVAVFPAFNLPERQSGAATFAAFATFVLLAFFVGTKRTNPRAATAAAASTLPWGLLLLRIAFDELHRPVSGCTNDGGFGILISCATLASLVAAGVALGIAFARGRLDSWIRVSAPTLVLVSLPLVAVALVHGRGADQDEYLASLPPGTDLRYGGGALIDGRWIHLRGVAVGGHAECRLTGLPHDDEPAVAYVASGPCPHVKVQVDRATALMIVEVGDERDHSWSAYALPGFERTALPASLPSTRVAAPVSWTLAAGAGALLATVLVVFAWRRRRRAYAADVAAVDGDHRGDGWVELMSGDLVRVAAAEPLPVGGVTLEGARPLEPTYRNTSEWTASRVLEGTSTSRRRAAHELAIGLESIALAIVVVSVAPLFTAAASGVL